MKRARTIEIVNGREIYAEWMPGEAAIIAEMSRLDWCRDHAELKRLCAQLVALRAQFRGVD